MHATYYRLNSFTVRAQARELLQSAWHWQPYKRSVTVQALLDVILLVASLTSSLSAVVRRFAWGFSHETARRALQANLPDLPRLTQGMIQALHACLPAAFYRRRWDVALDRHDVPFYGERTTQGVLGTQKKKGTHCCFSYATACVVHQGQRWCLGLVPLDDNDAEEPVEALLDALLARGIRIRCVLLDRGFFSGHVVLALQQRGVPFVVGVSRKGGRINKLFTLASGQTRLHRWQTARGNHWVETWMIRVGRRVRGRWRQEVYAFWGLGPSAAVGRSLRGRYFRERMRRRFGIETSYRQMNQGKGRTSSKDLRCRFLWLGVGLLLRQVWVCWEHYWRTVSPPHSRDCPLWWSLEVLLEWIADHLKQEYKPPKAISIPRPMEFGRPKIEKC